MEWLQLEYFAESAKTENFSKTAIKFLVPPSAVSAAIKRLEDELQCELFDRAANSVRLNENGRRFSEAVDTALAVLKQAKADLNPTPQQQETVSLLIRSERSFVNSRILAFREQFPHIHFHLTHNFTPHHLDKYDIIIDGASSEYRGCTQVPLVNENIKIAASRNSPLRGKKLLMRDLESEPFITMNSGSSLHRITHELCRNAGFSPNIVIESDDPLYIRGYISDNFGIAFYPELSWQEFSEDICFLDVADLEYTRTTYVYLNSGKPLTPAAKQFFEYISQ